jgi:hypothetical protein
VPILISVFRCTCHRFFDAAFIYNRIHPKPRSPTTHQQEHSPPIHKRPIITAANPAPKMGSNIHIDFGFPPGIRNWNHVIVVAGSSPITKTCAWE